MKVFTGASNFRKQTRLIAPLLITDGIAGKFRVPATELSIVVDIVRVPAMLPLVARKFAGSYGWSPISCLKFSKVLCSRFNCKTKDTPRIPFIRITLSIPSARLIMEKLNTKVSIASAFQRFNCTGSEGSSDRNHEWNHLLQAISSSNYQRSIAIKQFLTIFIDVN